MKLSHNRLVTLLRTHFAFNVVNTQHPTPISTTIKKSYICQVLMILLGPVMLFIEVKLINFLCYLVANFFRMMIIIENNGKYIFEFLPKFISNSQIQ